LHTDAIYRSPRHLRPGNISGAHQVAVVENHLIELLARKDRLSLLAICQPVQLVLEQVLCEPGTATRHVYFPVDGFISLVARLEGHPGLEVGIVGREGMLGAQVSLGVTTAPLHALVQGAGTAWRVGVPAFRREVARSASLSDPWSKTTALPAARSVATQRKGVGNSSKLLSWE